MTKPTATDDDKGSLETQPWFWKNASIIVSSLVAVIYYFSNPKPQSYYDYTFRVAGRLLAGHAGFIDPQPKWLNEFVPFEGFYYSVFPLGAALTMTPFALLKTIGVIDEMPGSLIAALLAGVICWLFMKIATRYALSTEKVVLLSLAMVLGTFMWTNLSFAGAWQLALGFSIVGQLGAIYFTVYDRRPFIAGVLFALAFGNRTECLLTAPVFFYLLWRSQSADRSSNNAARRESDRIRNIVLFCVVPFILGVATLAYNYARFHAISDFGYARIPGVLQEPWYDHGIFSTYYIPRQAWEMLLKMWRLLPTFPYLVPDGFSSSILLSSPFLLLALRVGAKDGALKLASWAAIAVLTFTLWIHGNSGGWQFGYRYAMVLLPWLFLLLLESSAKKISRLEWALCGFSIIANLYATWLFNWTDHMKP